jgi:hypothetical protein
MPARQLKARGIVIESRHRLPRRLRVAVCASGAQLALVLVLVAGKARLVQPKKSAVQVFEHDPGAARVRNIFRCVTLCAGKRSVFALQRESSLPAMIETRLRFGPADQREIAARMLHMTSRTLNITFGAVNDAAVISAFFGNALLNFDVARRTLQFGPAHSKLVTAPATQRSVHAAVRL